MKKYSFYVEVFDNAGQFYGSMTGGSIMANSESEAKQKALDYAKRDYPQFNDFRNEFVQHR